MSRPGFRPPPVDSANKSNNLGETLYRTVLQLSPAVVVEFGVLNGYSTMSIAQALRDLRAGHLWSFDLWEDCPYHHGDWAEVTRALEAAELTEFVTLGKRDFWDWLRQPTRFDLLCIDIANCGRVARAAADLLSSELARGSVVIFEGGTAERDLAWWMVKFDRERIAPLQDVLGFRVLDERFPSWSIMPAEAPRLR